MKSRLKIIFLSPFFFFLQVVHAQSSLEVSNKTFIYDALFITAKGDTLTKEKIELTFKDTPWEFQPKTQKNLDIKYFTDTAGIKDINPPFEATRKKIEKVKKKKARHAKGWGNWHWYMDKEVTTGYILNDSIFWIHPPRGNQYVYCEISGMPEVRFDQLAIGKTWTKELSILLGWHEFKGQLTSTYQVVDSTDYETKNIKAKNCWLIEVHQQHSELGQYTSQIVFDARQYGFLKFDHHYPDGTGIVMSLVGVE